MATAMQEPKFASAIDLCVQSLRGLANFQLDDLRRLAEDRGGGRCEYCRVSERGQVAAFPIDHVVPRGRGGVTELSNLAVACPRCNGHKWAHVDGEDPQTGERVWADERY